MTSTALQDHVARIVESAESHFGERVERITAPGGEGRSSFRVHFDDHSVIATLRPSFRRTHMEAFVLESLSAHCDDVPKCLGVADEILFQSDVGTRRLNQEIMRHDDAGQIDLAAQAVAAIFRFQNAARRTQLAQMMPHLGADAGWVGNFVNAVAALQPYSGGISSRFDPDAACAAIAQPGAQFVKWDCRSGNAAIGTDDRLRWFDFEYSGMRHGAEDFAWLIGDEAWPVAPEDMVDVMIDAYDAGTGHDIADYLHYMSVYITFHTVQRFRLIVKEAKRRGWLSKERVREYDDAGVHPEFAAQILKVGRYFSAQSRITAPLTRNVVAAMNAFLDFQREGTSLKIA